MPEKIPEVIPHQAWKDAVIEPMYPTNNVAYLIDIARPPEDGEREGTVKVYTKSGKTLLLWKSTFLQLVDIIDKNNWHHTKVCFSRPRGSKVTTVRLV